MSYKLTLEFDSEEARDAVLGFFSDGGGEDGAHTTLEMCGLDAQFCYKNAFPAWGWDGQGDPTIVVKTEES
ncbi:MAG: hypothetical protein K5880_14845 [Hydrogenophaga sp.]|uniref:hypothetical protein n=1 Tax=Hydrogenophaga sp. TaxID=1904254 RepID=UPI00262501CA|nr:hypothetical protein [Hydrogenophaga sp.]MCV0439875.1 hypothetical protein [Hydrogenophaga sp.]